MKKEAGITLIALVITIIILLILAGVSINTITGSDGIIGRAKQASEQTKIASVKEEIETELLAKSIDGDGQYTKDDVSAVAKKVTGNDLVDGKVKTKDGLEIDLSYLLEKGSDSKPKEVFLVAGEYATKVEKYKDTNGKIATIPAGFTVSNVAGETSINSGLVVYKGDLSSVNWQTGKDSSGNDIKRTYNQYVWIPCTVADYQRTEWGVEADGTPASKAFKDELTLSGIELSDFDQSNGITSKVTDEIVSQINAEKTSIEKYNGFYMGRYEVGEGNLIQQYKTPSASLIWSSAYANAKNIDVGTGNSSYLSSSYARDTALNFIQNNSGFKTYASSRDNAQDGTAINENWYDKSVTYIDASGASQTKAANNATRLPTGVTTAKCNIFDMGGNVSEFTTELNPLTNGDNDATVVLRGGNFWGTGVWLTSPAGSRWDASSAYAGDSRGFRATLFIQ